MKSYVDDDRIECNRKNRDSQHLKYVSLVCSGISDLTSNTTANLRSQVYQRRRLRSVDEAMLSRYESLHS
jgi:hypothetical protein